MNRYKLALEAQQDLRDIIDYLTEQGGTRAARYVTGALTVAFRQLAARGDGDSLIRTLR